MGYVLGVDGGSTKTIALVADRRGVVVGSGRAGGSNIYVPRPDMALAAVEQAATAALDAAGVGPSDLDVGVFSMSGADWPEDIDFIRSEMARRRLGRAVVVVNDAIGGLRAGSPDGNGIVVVCGTGTAVGARAPDGQVWHTSFWQEPGGSEELGRKTLRAAYRAELGVDPPTGLTPHILAFFGLSSIEAVLHAFTARLGTPPTTVAGLTRVLLDEAERGDATARRVILEHGDALGDYALAAARRVGIEATPFTLVLAGGVLRHPSRLLADALVARARASSPEVRAVNSRFEPAVGALLLALEAAGARIDESLLERLTTTLPPSQLYLT